MATTASFVDDPGRGVRLEVLIEGTGHDVILLPSSHRGAADFALLSAELGRAGYRAVAVNPRGVGASTGPLDLSMRDIADDVAMVIEQLSGGRAHVVGHALGNTFARATASYRPEVVHSLALLACGGHNLAHAAPPPLVMEHFARCSDTSLPVTIPRLSRRSVTGSDVAVAAGQVPPSPAPRAPARPCSRAP